MKKKTNKEMVLELSCIQFCVKKEITENELIKAINIFAKVNPISETEKEEVLKEMGSRLGNRLIKNSDIITTVRGESNENIKRKTKKCENL